MDFKKKLQIVSQMFLTMFQNICLPLVYFKIYTPKT